MSEFSASRGSTKTAISYMIGLKKLYNAGMISKLDYFTVRGVALVLLFGMSKEDALKQMKVDFEEDEDGKHGAKV